MYRKKYLFIILVILLGVIAYLFIFKTQSPTTVATSLSNKINNHTATKPLVAKTNQKLVERNVTQEMSCPELAQANKFDKKNKAAFISTKAIQWHFEGHDKYKIAETLAATFNYAIAMQWIATINSLSRNHAEYTQRIQAIDSLSYTSNFLHSSRYMKQNSQTSNFDGGTFDINQKFNQYPDLAIQHWNTALEYALHNKNLEGALSAIKELKESIEKPQFFQHPLKNTELLLPLTSFTQQEIEIIIKALFDLSPVFIEPSAQHYERTYKSSLAGLEIDESLWNFQRVNPDNFVADSTIIHLIEQIKNQHPLLNKLPIAENYCLEESANTASEKIKVIKLKARQSKNTLPPAWQGVSSVSCPSKLFIHGMLLIKKKLNHADIALTDLASFESLQEHSVKLKQVIEQLDENQLSSFFNLIYLHNRELEYMQIKALIHNEMTPTNSDFYLLIRRLPLAQQKELLTAHQYNLTNTNGFDFSMIINALMYSADNQSEELIPFLIEQGFPLKESGSSPDPLWMQLNLLSNSGRYKDGKLPVRSLSSLIEHTELNETHIDAMYKIKQQDIGLYENLIEKFPELKFDQPEALVEINCQ